MLFIEKDNKIKHLFKFCHSSQSPFLTEENVKWFSSGPISTSYGTEPVFGGFTAKQLCNNFA